MPAMFCIRVEDKLETMGRHWSYIDYVTARDHGEAVQIVMSRAAKKIKDAHRIRGIKEPFWLVEVKTRKAPKLEN